MMAPPAPKGPPRHPPAYNVAAQMARLQRLGRAHSHEGVTSTALAAGVCNIGSGGGGSIAGSISSGGSYYHPDPGDEDG